MRRTPKESYKDRYMECCYTCSFSKEEAEGQYNIWCELAADRMSVDVLGICNLYHLKEWKDIL